MRTTTSRRRYIVVGGLATSLVFFMLIWAKLRLVTDIPRTAIAEPQSRQAPAPAPFPNPDDASNAGTNSDRATERDKSLAPVPTSVPSESSETMKPNDAHLDRGIR